MGTITRKYNQEVDKKQMNEILTVTVLFLTRTVNKDWQTFQYFIFGKSSWIVKLDLGFLSCACVNLGGAKIISEGSEDVEKWLITIKNPKQK